MLKNIVNNVNNFLKKEIHYYKHLDNEKLLSFHKEMEFNKLRLVFRYIQNESLINLESVFLSKFLHAKISLDQENLTLSLGFLLFTFWLSFENKLIYKLHDKYKDKTIGISYSDGLLWWDLFSDPHFWSSKTPKWKSGSINLHELVFGKETIKENILEEKDITISMPESDYNGTAKLIEVILTNRWGRKNIKNYVYLNIPKGVPVPGKGENSWDCEDDAIYGFSYPDNSIDNTIKNMQLSIFDRRLKYGGKKWSPCVLN